jgi:imidazole glycerol-phosphate synthase subunit HisH
MSIVIIDYGMGNTGSIANMLKKAGIQGIISSDIQIISQAEKLILPGVGSFDTAMNYLNHSGLIDILNKKVLYEKVPVLGVCLGMQLMTKGSEEGKEKGLSWMDASTFKFNFSSYSEKLRVPHMGWNTVVGWKYHPLIKDMDLANSRFYFVHSYYVRCTFHYDILLNCHYGIEFVAAFQKENIIGVQFHPEKSHKFGVNMFRNFISL